MAGSAPKVDWDAITEEATQLLSEFIRIDTSNPPGRERAACEWLAGIFRREGIDAVAFYDASDAREFGEDRMNMTATLPGDGSRPPLILLSHTDVVPVERQYWDFEPFSGAVRDGVIYGRGAIDMKSMGIMELMAMLLVKRLGLPHARDIVYMALADEEAGGTWGIEWIERHHPELLDAEYVINEGGWGNAEVFGTRRPSFNCSISEKGPLWLRLVAEGRPGHGSVPHPDNALDRLVRALQKVQDWQRPVTLVPELTGYFERLHRHQIVGEPTPDALERLAGENLFARAILTNTVSTTTAHAGIKHNVIPGVAEATLDCRLLPGQDTDAFIEQVREVVADPKVRIETIYASSTPASSAQTELFAIIEDVVHEHMEEALVLPSVSAGFTDSRVFRVHGITSYGFIPILLEQDEAVTVHGHNERIRIENLRLGTQILFETVRRLCA
ncbi:MAG TPA: M20/M25/M40 family metallo-hydrolase [Dehalococcoidia bacterium]|nr:M20/M25/M40 family metallo-hydrolase [Dehalococcoidia bacterium]